MKPLLLLSLFSLLSTCHSCNFTNTWVILENFDDDSDSATFPSVDYQNDTFCVSTKDMTNGKAFYASTKLSDPDEKSSFEQLSYRNLDKFRSTCVFKDSSVQGCLSRCEDDNLEKFVIQAAMSSSNPSAVVQKLSKDLSSSKPVVIITTRLDPSDNDQLISYDYFNDPNFCSVLANIKKNLSFPYGIFTTVQIIA